jgi:hemoglobin
MTTLYERLGGASAIETAVEIFYRRMLRDERVARFFDAVDMERQMAKQAAFLTMVTGGPANYTGKDMRAGHAHLVAQGLDDSHVDVVIDHLGAVLAELGADPEDIATVAAVANSVRDDVLSRGSTPAAKA